MGESWTILFWLQLRPYFEIPDGVGMIVRYRGVTLFLRVKDHVLGIDDSEHIFLGPKVIGLENEPWICFGLTRNQNKIALYLNGEEVLVTVGADTALGLEEFRVKVPDRSKIKIIKQDLSEWVTRRESMFKMQAATTEDYVILPVKDQEDQLSNRLYALQDMLNALYQGRKYYFEDIVANLRSLIFYKGMSRSYDPLLLRLATFKNLSLPVYIAPGEEDSIQQFIAGIGDPPYFWGLNAAKFKPEIPCVKMVDLQDYLENTVLFYNGQFISPLKLIEMLATTQSVAHFDQRVPKLTEGLKDTPVVFGYNTLEHYILLFAELITKVGTYVLGGDPD